MTLVIREGFPRIRQAVKNGTTYWICDCRSKRLLPDGKELWFATQAAALEKRAEVQMMLESGNVVSKYDLACLKQWKARISELKDYNPKKPMELLNEAIDRFITSRNKREETKEEKEKISELCELWVEAKTRGDYRKLRKSTLVEIKHTAAKITEMWGHKTYQSLDKDDIRKFMESLTDYHQTTKKKWVIRIGGFCSWVIADGKGRGNPCRGFKVASTPKDIPQILTIDQTKSLLTTCEMDKQYLPMIKFLALGLFAGLRPNEIQRLKPEDIQLEATPFTRERYKNIGQINGIIDIKVVASKTGRPRKVVINDTLARYLRQYQDQPIFPKVNFRKNFEALRASAGFVNWPADIIRHTSASYFVSKSQDWQLTASQFGNSVAVLERYYVDTIHPSMIDQFYDIRPTVLS
jgi:hypothetical protein